MQRKGQYKDAITGSHTFFGRARGAKRDRTEAEKLEKYDKKIEKLIIAAIRAEYTERIKEKLEAEYTKEAAEEILQTVITKMKADGSFDKMRADYMDESKRLRRAGVDKANDAWRATLDKS